MAGVAVARVGLALLSSDLRRLAVGAIGALFLGAVAIAAYHEGLLVTGNMLDYRVPTIEDSPPIEVGIIESNDPHGPFGAKEAGEGSLAAFLPALTNAIADAIGLRCNTLPVTPDRVFAALEKRRRAGNGSAGNANNADPR